MPKSSTKIENYSQRTINQTPSQYLPSFFELGVVLLSGPQQHWPKAQAQREEQVSATSDER